MCGFAHGEGDPVGPFEPGNLFTDYGALRGPGSDLACGWCLATWTKPFLQRHAKSVICSEGVFPAASNDHLAYWMLNPPAGEWLFIQSDQKMQHLLWRAPVNNGQEIYTVRFGEKLFTLRPRFLREGADAAKRLAERLSAKRKGAHLKSPFIRLSRDVDTPAHGTLRREAYLLASEPDAARDIECLHRLTPGELWGLTAVMYATNPNRPAPSLTPAV